MKKHAKPRPRRRSVRLARAASRHPVRTLKRGHGESLERWGFGIGVIPIGAVALAVASWVIFTLFAL